HHGAGPKQGLFLWGVRQPELPFISFGPFKQGANFFTGNRQRPINCQPAPADALGVSEDGRGTAAGGQWCMVVAWLDSHGPSGVYCPATLSLWPAHQGAALWPPAQDPMPPS